MNDTLFENTADAFTLKSDSELDRAYFLFKMISAAPLVKIGTTVTKFALNVNLPVEGLIRATVFDHFCGGINKEDCLPVVDRLYEKRVNSVLDFSVEGKENEEQFNATLNKVEELTIFAQNRKEMPFAVFKPTGLGRFKIWQKVSEKASLNNEEQQEWERIEKRFDVICKIASDKNIVLLIDAEESWMQDAADNLVTRMMEKYNRDKVVVYNTLQCYRWDRLDYLRQLHKEAIAKGYKLGFKIVRGAYMEKENDRAKSKGYKSPICESKQSSDDNFDAILKYIFSALDDISLFIGTHNEASCYLAMHMIGEKQLSLDDNRVWFGQLYGMSDHISFNLAKAGYNVAKYIPFGPVKDVMPYLIRRAEENTSVAGQTSRELALIKKEKARRKI